VVQVKVAIDQSDPEPTNKDGGHLGYWNGPKELFEWKHWEEVKPSEAKDGGTTPAGD